MIYKKTIPDAKGNYFMHYSTSAYDCKECPYAKQCKGKSNEKRVRVTVYKEYHDRMEERMQTKQGKIMRKLRQSTIEPVFGSLINFYGMRKINVRGMKLANKCMLMAAIAYNLKKVMKYNGKRRETNMIKQLSQLNHPIFEYLFTFLKCFNINPTKL